MAEFASYSAHSFGMALERDQEAKKVFAKDEEVLLEKFNSKKNLRRPAPWPSTVRSDSRSLRVGWRCSGAWSSSVWPPRSRSSPPCRRICVYRSPSARTSFGCACACTGAPPRNCPRRSARRPRSCASPSTVSPDPSDRPGWPPVMASSSWPQLRPMANCWRYYFSMPPDWGDCNWQTGSVRRTVGGRPAVERPSSAVRATRWCSADRHRRTCGCSDSSN